jgi:hypothetical protein
MGLSKNIKNSTNLWMIPMDSSQREADSAEVHVDLEKTTHLGKV